MLGVVQDELAKQGGRLLAVATDSPEESARVVAQGRLNFAILSDVEGTLLERFGVRHAGGGPRGTDIAIPARFLLDRDGRIAWRFISSRVTDRADVAATLAAVRSLAGSP